MESHCFGCEHVFAGEKSQGVAEGVFLRMLAARPDKPTLHYLLGYLFLKLLELDPRRRHASPDLSRVSDLPRLWQAMQVSQRLIATLPAGSPLWD